MSKKEGIFNLLEYIPNKIVSGKQFKEYDLSMEKEFSDAALLSYISDINRKYSQIIPKFISKNQETFEVLGLLQAEMGKTQNGCITFANSEPKIINKVIKWFEKEFHLTKDIWSWYVKLNLNEPQDKEYKKYIEHKCLQYWLEKSKLNIKNSYPKKISYISQTTNKKLKNYYYGTLIIEHKNNLLSQIIKRFVRLITGDIANEIQDYIKYFMKGIIAGESNVECHKPDKRYRVYISASKDHERQIFKECLEKLYIPSKKYTDDLLIISKRENLVKLLQQRLMTLHPRKYNKFLNMMQQYPGISQETGYFTGTKKAWNKIPQDKINQIIELYKSGTTRTEEIVKKVGASHIKVCRVLKENNLGKRLIKTPEEKRKEIAQFAKENPKLTQKQIANHFNVHDSVIARIFLKYKIKNKSRFKIPEEKIQQIIQIYKENPAVKYSEIEKEVKVSGTVIGRVRRENNLIHLGYKYLMGCNNPNKKQIIQNYETA